MKQRLLQLEPRQQAMLASGASVLMLAVTAALLFGLHEGRKLAQQQLATTASTLSEVKALSAALASLQRSASTDEDLTASVTRSLQSFGLQPSRLQQIAQDELQLRIDSIAFADAVAWLAMLEQTPGVTLVGVSMTPAGGGKTAVVVSIRRA